jgi:hypothetical protein
MAQIVDILEPNFPQYVYAMVLSYLDPLNEDEDLILLLNRHAGSLVYRYHIENILFGNGRFISVDGSPTFYGHTDTGRLYFVAWTNPRGLLHRDDGPAVIVYDRNHYAITWQIWVENGILGTSDENVASAVFNGEYYTKMWCERVPLRIEDFDHEAGVDFRDRIIPHCEEYPSMIDYYPDGSFKSVRWFLHGRKGRLQNDSPAISEYDMDGSTTDTFVNWRGNVSKRVIYDGSGEIISQTITSHERARLRGHEGAEPIDEFTEDSVLEARGLLGVDFRDEDQP